MCLGGREGRGEEGREGGREGGRGEGGEGREEGGREGGKKYCSELRGQFQIRNTPPPPPSLFHEQFHGQLVPDSKVAM